MMDVKKAKITILMLFLTMVCLASGNAGAADVPSLSYISNEAIATVAPFPAGKTLATGKTGTLMEHTSILRNVSFAEVRDFILDDPTNRKPFILDKYECRHFATEVNKNAVAAGIRCAIVLICYERGQHAVVAFETTDRGLVFIEPQTDAVIRPEVGGAYQGMEIKEILIAW